MSVLAAILTTIMVLAASAGAFFVAVVLVYMGVLIRNEIVDKTNKPYSSRASRKRAELNYELYLEKLYEIRTTRPYIKSYAAARSNVARHR